MCPLVEAAAVLPPADAMALNGWPIAVAHHVLSPQLVIVDLHSKGWQKRQRCGRLDAILVSAVWCHLLISLWRERQL
jgi:hypothetical protein